jgi:hypothetical protein
MTLELGARQLPDESPVMRYIARMKLHASRARADAALGKTPVASKRQQYRIQGQWRCMGQAKALGALWGLSA